MLNVRCLICLNSIYISNKQFYCFFFCSVHIPTFVNFLREIESCNDIENYVIDYLGESQHAKDFAHQFYINRETQVANQFLNERQLLIKFII